jgi:predicted Rossmann fold flavoprotein
LATATDPNQKPEETKPLNLTDDKWDVIVVGAGAAGLMAAASAGIRGRRVLVLEKNTKIGVKILMSGGTRCNITHNCDSRGIADAFGRRQGKFLRSALAALSPEEVIYKIESLGVATKVEDTGKIFPVSNKAIDVRDALVTLATDAKAKILTEHPVTNILRRDSGESDDEPGGFVVQTEQQRFEAKNLIITTGGKSYPGCGTTGDGYAWAESFGHSIVNTVPALAPIVCDREWVHELKGITIEDCELSVFPESQAVKGKPKRLDTRRGPLLFTHFGFSGPTAMNISRAVTRFGLDNPVNEKLVMRCDFLPTLTPDQLTDRFNQQKQRTGKQVVGQLLSPFFPRRLVEALLNQVDIPQSQNNGELSKKQVHRLTDVVKRTDFPLNGTQGYKKAEVTAGGVNLKEVDSRDMQSKSQPGLFFAGEILDIDGPIGGFNFQAAFSTGWLAGQHV